MAGLAQWDPPWPTRGGPSFERVSTSHLRSGGCAEQAAKKARPEVWPDDSSEFVESMRGDFPLSLVRDAVLSLLASQPDSDADTDDAIASAVRAAATASGDDWPSVSVDVVERAVGGYLAVREGLASTGELPASQVAGDVVAFQAGALPLELYAWGIWHFVDDGRQREVHLPRWQNADGVRLDDAQVALAAMIAGTGAICEAKPLKQWSQPYVASATQPRHSAERVRVRVVGVLDASEAIRFDGTLADAVALYEAHAMSAFEMLAGGSFRPSRSCAGCSLRRSCPALLRLPGLLGTTGFSAPTRSITPSDLTAYALCPKRVWLQRDLGMPALYDDSPAQSRGQRVHAWLEAAHARGTRCSDADVLDPRDLDLDAPLPADAGVAADLGWTASDYAEALPYLRAHITCCPIDDHVITASSEHTITAWDTDANVVASARVDLAYTTDDGRQHYRETKTLNMSRLPDDELELLTYFPQVALAACMLADDPRIAPGRVELELLGEEAAAMVPFDAADPRTVLEARTALADAVDRWLFDTTHLPLRAAGCEWCPMRHVCPDSTEADDVLRPMRPTSLIPLIDVSDSSPATLQHLHDVSDTAPDDDDFPF